MKKMLFVSLLIGIQLFVFYSCVAYSNYSFTNFSKQKINISIDTLITFCLEKKYDKTKPKSYYFKMWGIPFFSTKWQINDTYLGKIYLNFTNSIDSSWKAIDKILVTNEEENVLFKYTSNNSTNLVDVNIYSNSIIFPLEINNKIKKIYVIIHLDFISSDDENIIKKYEFIFTKEDERYFGPLFFGA